MLNIFRDTPLWMHIIIVAGLIPLTIYAIKDLEKKKPGHPFKYNLYCLMPVMLITLCQKVVDTYSTNSTISSIMNYIFIISVFILFITLIVSSYLACKKGFIAENKKYLIANIAIPCFIVAAVSIVLLNVIYFCWD